MRDKEAVIPRISLNKSLPVRIQHVKFFHVLTIGVFRPHETDAFVEHVLSVARPVYVLPVDFFFS